MASRDPRGVRPLLPAPLTTISSGLPLRPTLFEQGGTLPPRKRGKQVDLACDACKKRKSKCDGRRPECLACGRKGTECFYDEQAREANKVAGLKRQNTALEEELSGTQNILAYLRQCPDGEAHALFDSIRDGTSAVNIIDSLPSPLGLEASLSAQHPPRGRQYSFATTATEGIDNGSVSLPRARGRLGLFYVARQAGLIGDARSQEHNGAEELIFSIKVPTKLELRPRQVTVPNVRSPRLKPELNLGADILKFGSDAHHSPFLLIRSHQWTTIITNDVFFSRLICLWLSHHAMCLPYIYPTFFLEGLRSGRPTEHCSPLLVHAILAVASQYSTEQTLPGPPDQPGLRGLSFYNAAYQLWEAEEGRSSISTVQALIAMYEFNKLRGKDRIGWLLLHAAVEMAIDLGLCKQMGTGSVIQSEGEFAKCFVGWSIYIYQAVESLVYCKMPHIRRCWAGRITEPFRRSEVTEKWRPYNISEGVTRESYFWQHWDALCSLADIHVDAACLLFADDADGIETPNNLLIQQADDLTAELEMWRSGLPSVLSLEANEMPHNLWLHMNYYMLIIALHRPYISPPTDQTAIMPTEVGHAKQNMIQASKSIIRLATIAVEHFGYNHRTAYDSQTCAAAAFTLVQDLGSTPSLNDLLQCVAILHAQASRFLLSGALARSILLTAQDLATSAGKEALQAISTALRANMTIDYLALGEGGPGTKGRSKHGDTSLSRFVSSRFPSTLAALHGHGHGVINGGIKLDEVLSRLENLQLDRAG